MDRLQKKRYGHAAKFCNAVGEYERSLN